MGAPARSVPHLSADPFAADFLRDPFAGHEELREAGPVVWLSRYGIWGMARYAEVHEALRDWETFCSSAGVGLSDFRKGSAATSCWRTGTWRSTRSGRGTG
jgi:cytochrome P450